MNAGMKMLMVDAARKGGSGRSGGRMGYSDGNYARMGYDGAENGYEAESRFRDRTGREHYDNGRFAPMRNAGGMEARMGSGYGEMEMRRGGSGGRSEMGNEYDGPDGRYNARETGGARSAYPFVPPVYQGGNMRSGGDRMNQIGFTARDEVGMNYPMDATYDEGRQMEHGKGHMSGYAMGSEEGSVQPLTRDVAVRWVQSMKGPEGVKGQFWSMEQTANIMSREGYQCNPLEWYVAMNMMKRDYAEAAMKLGIDKEEFYAAMANSFLKDADALPGKLMRYYQAVVKKS